ncbi:MAG: DUF1501 domain-containing protein [Pirellulales bacterium]|nr:DUF1501 domain-containing protein [Pirellulales bacterium]
MSFKLADVACGSLRASRRRWLQFGLLGAWAATWRPAAEAATVVPPRFGRAKRCILVFLNGGPSQLDTWDMKPAAPAEIRGELLPIATSVPGIQVAELFPQLARHVDKLKIVRSVTHTASVHTTGVYTMLTCSHHPTPMVDQTRAAPTDHPHLGSVVARHRGWRGAMPPFFCLPMYFQAPPVEGIWPGQNAGFLGRPYDPFVVTGDKATARFTAPALELPGDLSPARLQGRRQLWNRLDEPPDLDAHLPMVPDTRPVWEQAFAMLGDAKVEQALDLSREPESVRARYGDHLFGQGLLLARRLVEASESFVTVNWVDPTPAGPGGGEYDSHGRLYWHMRNRLAAPTDQALSALIADLWDRGLHEDTLLIVMSEFGRSPRLNADAGRDHWPAAQSILLAGAGVSGGAVHGATDRHAAHPVSDPITPPDLGQSILHLLGVPADLELHDQQRRPMPASRGQVDGALIS